MFCVLIITKTENIRQDCDDENHPSKNLGPIVAAEERRMQYRRLGQLVDHQPELLGKGGHVDLCRYFWQACGDG